MKPITAVPAATLLVSALLTGCSTPVPGTASSNGAVALSPEPTTTTRPPATTTTRPVPTPPTSIDPDATQQYCDNPILGALGKHMQVVVVETPSGRTTCDQAAAILTDYYANRPTPDPAATPIEVDTFACNQVPVPDLPQVICTDGASLLYSMWPQGGGN